MTQVTVDDPIAVITRQVDSSGRISVGREHAGDSVEVVVAKVKNDGAGDTAETAEETAEA